MPRLPVNGSDDGTWGTILNDYLTQSHNADGTLKANVVSNTNIVDGTIQSPKLAQTYIQSSEKGSANGVASLDATAKVPASQLPPAADPAMGGDLTGTASNAQIATGAVGTSELADLSVSLAKLAATVAQSLSPTGAITPFAGTTAPTGWFTCDGSAVSRTTYATLFTAIGTTYGVGDGTTTFNLPNLRGRVPVGIDSTQTEFDVRGETGGAKSTVLTSAHVPQHNHTIAHSHAANTNGGGGVDHLHYVSLGGGGHEHTYSARLNNRIVTGGGAATVTDSAGGSYGTTGGGGHSHAGNSGAADRSLDHNHGITVGGSDTASSGNYGTASPTAVTAIQPYIALDYIIKY